LKVDERLVVESHVKLADVDELLQLFIALVDASSTMRWQPAPDDVLVGAE
jgi:hypothetical protein